MEPEDYKDGLTQDHLREILNYDEKTGAFTWRKKTAQCVKIGAAAGSFDAQGYHLIGIRGRYYKAHRLAWLYMTGEWPPYIDHIDGIKNNNSFDNLRTCTKKQNIWYRGRFPNNTSGFKGVCYHKRLKKWQAYIRADNRRIHLGYHKTPEDAHQAYCIAAARYHGDFAKTH